MPEAMTLFLILRSNVLNIRVLSARRWLLSASAILVLLVVAACGPAPLGTGWPSVSLIKSVCGDTSSLNVMISYMDRIVQVNPADGKSSPLLNSDCEPRPPESDGKPRVWDFRPSGGKQFYTTPLLLQDNTLLVIANDQHIFRIDATTARAEDADGAAIDGRTGHAVTDLAVSDDLIYVGLSAKDVVALERDTLDVRWTFETEHGVWGKPLLQDGVLYFSSLDHYLYAVDAELGELKWKLDLEGAVTGMPLYANDRLYIGSFARKLFEISLDGEIVNQYSTVDWVWGTPTIQDDILYFADLGGYVYALDTAANLSEVWKQQVATRAIRPSPLVTGDTLIVVSRDHKIYWRNRADGSPILDAEGNPLVRELQGEILSDILLVQPEDGVNITKPYIIVSTTSPSQLLAAYTLDNGESKWSYSYQ